MPSRRFSAWIPKHYHSLYTIAQPFRWQLVVLGVITLAAALAEILSLSMILPLLDIAIHGKTAGGVQSFLLGFIESWPVSDKLVFILIAMATLIILKSILTVMRLYLSGRITTGIREYWSNLIARQVLQGDISLLYRYKHGQLVDYTTMAPLYASEAVMEIMNLTVGAIYSIVFCGFLLYTNWMVTLAFVGFFAVVALPGRRMVNRYVQALGHEQQIVRQSLTSAASENVTAARLLRAYSAEERFLKTFAGLNRILGKGKLRIKLLRGLPSPLTESMVGLALIGAGIYIGSTGKFNIADHIPMISMLFAVFYRLTETVSNLLSRRIGVFSQLSSLELLENFARDQSTVTHDESGQPFTGFQKEISFEKVTFSYADRPPVLKDFHLVIDKGRTVALTGPSGIGKSTLADLLCRFQEPTSGRILVDGTPLSEFSLGSWRARIAYVTQDTVLLNRTILENIRLGVPDASEEDVQRAARQAAAHGFIMTLPQGYATHVHDNGMNFSGGQRQRIALARAILRNPELYILDEITSSLDPQSEDEVKGTIQSFRSHKTVLLIAHQESMIEVADVVYALSRLKDESLTMTRVR